MSNDVSFSPEKYPTLHRFVTPLRAASRKIVGRETDVVKILSALARLEMCNPLLLAEAGIGKAHPNDTLIAVNDERGYVRFDQLVVGDEVFGRFGQPVPVIGIFPQGFQRKFLVGFVDGSEVPCNDRHLWDVRNTYDRYVNKPYRTMSLREIMDAGVANEKGTNTWSVPVGGAVEREIVEFGLDPYALGALIGDGCLTMPNDRPAGGGALAMSSDDEFVVARVAEALGAEGHVRSPHNYNWQFFVGEGNATRRAQKFIQRQDVADLEDLDGVMFTKSIHRRVPEKYFQGSIEQRLELLRGLFDTDGSVSSDDRTRVTFHSNSHDLAQDIRDLLASIGVRSTMSGYDRGGRHVNTEYVVHVKLADDQKSMLFSLPRHLDKIEDHRRGDRKFNKVYTDLAINSVVDTGEDVEMTCIMVGADDHLYQVGREHVVTHNTSLVQATMLVDTKRSYWEVNLEQMLADHDAGAMAAYVKLLFDEARRYHRETGEEIVIFMDEVHRLIDLSPMSVEAVKPVLASSGSEGLKIIAATTKAEYLKFIAPNIPLAERFQRIDIEEPDRPTVIAILRGFVERYGKSSAFPTDRMFELIYDYAQRYVPDSAQPRKSVKLLDEMFGWHAVTGRPMDEKLLADVVYSSTGNNVAFRVDVDGLEKYLNSQVLSQRLAVRAVAKRIHLGIAGMNDPNKPMGTFLFAGPTGVGKSALSKALAEALFGDAQRHFIRFDLAEYANDNMLERFREELTDRVWGAPFSVILLDEIEKASPAVSKLLLSVLDDARLTNANGREVSFRNSWIVLTTNAGSQSFKSAVFYTEDVDDGLRDYQKLIARSIRDNSKSFPTELYNRIQHVAPFRPLSAETKSEIITMNLAKIYMDVRRRHGVRIVADERVQEYLAFNLVQTDTDDGGARGAIRAINDEIASAVAEYINKNPGVRVINMGVEGILRSEDKFENKTRARIVISAG